MKLFIVAVLLASASAFTPSYRQSSTFVKQTLSLEAVSYGPGGKPASSNAEDLELTRNLILEFNGMKEGGMLDEEPSETPAVEEVKAE